MTSWTIDLSKRKIQHSSGLTIIFEGKPDSHHFSGSPSNYPNECAPFELSRLIREGFESYTAAWNKHFLSAHSDNSKGTANAQHAGKKDLTPGSTIREQQIGIQAQDAPNKLQYNQTRSL